MLATRGKRWLQWAAVAACMHARTHMCTCTQQRRAYAHLPEREGVAVGSHALEGASDEAASRERHVAVAAPSCLKPPGLEDFDAHVLEPCAGTTSRQHQPRRVSARAHRRPRQGLGAAGCRLAKACRQLHRQLRRSAATLKHSRAPARQALAQERAARRRRASPLGRLIETKQQWSNLLPVRALSAPAAPAFFLRGTPRVSSPQRTHVRCSSSGHLL
jgi:hypothetical protein